MTKKSLLIIFFNLLFNIIAPNIFALPDLGITSKEILNSINNPKLIGKSQLSFFGLKIYDIALWSEDDKFSYKKKFAINIKYKRNITKKELIDRSITEIKKTYEITNLEEKKYHQKLSKIFVNISEDDQKTVIFNPKIGVKLYFNSKLLGEIKDLDFARKFVDIWLSDESSYPKISKKLTGKLN